MKNVIKKMKPVLVTMFIIRATILFSSAQEKSTELQLRPFGIGIHVEQLHLSDLINLGQSENVTPVNSLVMSVNAGNVFRFEPEIGLLHMHNEQSKLSSNSAKYGIGLYPMFQYGNLNMYAGVRLLWTSSSTEDSVYAYQSSYLETRSTTSFGFGPVLGGEYFFGNHFSFGGNISFIFSSLQILQQALI